MKNNLCEITIQRSRSVQDQIREQLRAMILGKALTPGAKLPSTHDLAKLWGTHSSTVHGALQPLVREGLISRAHRAGTFVRRREAKLTCVGIYDTMLDLDQSLYRQSLQLALKRELAALGCEMDLRLDPRPDKETGEPWRPLVRAAERREIQALIATKIGRPQLSWLRRLPVPAALHSTADVPNAVNFRHEQFAELSVRALAQQGCRSVGIISAWPPERLSFYGHLVDVIGDLGLRVKNEWLRQAPAPTRGGGPAQEQFGHEQFLRLWAHPKRPDGLIVYPDTVARGVILGLLEKQVRVPAELKLALHKNEAIDLLCPVPATFVVSSERELARALVKQVQKQFRGEECEPINIPFRLAAHRRNSPPQTAKPQERSQS